MQFRRKVKPGSKTGQKIGFPTINLNIGSFSDYNKPGAYTCKVLIGKKEYLGALYFGQKMHHKAMVLEIHILNFSHKIYGQFITFKVGKKIRSPKQFTDLQELKKQIAKDIKSVI
ncbi:riboflavin kinase [Patescibacteria group bacterium]|nr:riboflavin kinase [Patescibacteria group bacterium]MBU1683120.1 riboflavin kinase [Patescibacteria group bacterium]